MVARHPLQRFEQFRPSFQRLPYLVQISRLCILVDSRLASKEKDSDGMPDKWEKKHGLNPGDSSDNNKDKDGDGYTNIEEWLNGTDPGKKF